MEKNENCKRTQMDPDNNEAFIHNVCKKTAQLARVASDFNNSHFDHAVKLGNISKKYAQYFDSIVEQTRKNAQDAFNKLVQYRKAQIEDSCHEYGLQYKQIKSNFAHTLNEKSTELNNISRDAKQQNRNIKEMTRDSILLAKSVLSTADEVEKSLKAQSRCQSPNITPEIRDKLMEIRTKADQEKKRSLDVINDMKQHYRNIAVDIKNQIKSIIFQEVRNRKSQFNEILSKLSSLKQSNNELNERKRCIVEEYLRKQQAAKARRESIMDETKADNKKYLEQKQKLLSAKKAEYQTNTNKTNNAKSILKTTRASQQQMLKDVAKLIEKQRTDSHELEKSIAQRRKEKINQLSLYEVGFLQQQKSEMQLKLEEIGVQQQIIEERRLTTVYLDDKSRELSNTFMNELHENQTKFSNNLKKSEFDMQTYFNESRNKYNQWKTDQISFLQDSFANISDESRHNRKIIRKASHKAKKDIAEEMAVNAREREEKNKKNETEKNNYQLKLDEQTKAKNEFHENKIKQIELTNSKKFQAIKDNFNNDLKKHKSEIEKNKQYPAENYSLSDEESEFKHEKDLLEAKFDYSVRQIDIAKVSREKKINELQTALFELDKKKRMIERNFKTTNDKIVSDYEMQIQFAQVQLSDKIDKISSFYEADENARGRDIIEAIRKVLQTKNRTKDLSLKKEEEKAAKLKSIEVEKSKIIEEMRQFNEGIKEDNLSNELKNMEHDFELKTQEIDQAAEKMKEEINLLIQNEIQSTENTKKAITQQEESENKEYQLQQAHIMEKNSKIALETTEKKGEIIDIYNEKRLELEKKYESDLKLMRHRINSARDSLNEYQNECIEKYNAEKNKLSLELSEKDEHLPQLAQQSIDKLLAVNSELHVEIDKLSQKITELTYQYMIPVERNTEVKQINESKNLASSLLIDIEGVFKPLIDIKMRKLTHPVFYKTVATNTDTEPIPLSALEMPKTNNSQAQTPTTGHRPKASIVYPIRSSRVFSENML